MPEPLQISTFDPPCDRSDGTGEVLETDRMFRSARSLLMADGRVLRWIRSLNVRRALLRLLQKFLLQVDYGGFSFCFATTCARVPAVDGISKSARALVMVLWDGSGRDICVALATASAKFLVTGQVSCDG